MTTKRTFAALVFTTVTAMVVTTAAPAGADDGYVAAEGELRDLDTAAINPTDGAYAQFIAFGIAEAGTHAVLVVTGLAESAAGTTLGAHVHSGSCVAGQPATAGPHYNTEGPTGAANPALADEEHEVWLDFTVNPGGFGIGWASVPFVIPAGGAHAVVIHRDPTGAGGVAGPRLACLPVEF